MKIAVIGATGLVGREMLKVLEEEKMPVSELIPIASASSVGQSVLFNGSSYPVISIEEGLAYKPDIALFSAGGSVSKTWAPLFVDAGAIVIDNSSAWRMEPEVPLIVPEINSTQIQGAKLIANPNCSTIQLVMAIAPLHRAFTLKRIVISTYQSVTGTGKKAVSQLMQERIKGEVEQVYGQQIDLNCLPHCDIFLENEYTREEMKLVHETRKILSDNRLRITATAVRVPVIGGHSESVNLEFEHPFTMEEAYRLLENQPGVFVQRGTSYTTPLEAKGKNEVFVSRIRRDESIPNGLNLWIVADNLRKGAATNAVQIAKVILQNEPAGLH